MTTKLQTLTTDGNSRFDRAFRLWHEMTWEQRAEVLDRAGAGRYKRTNHKWRAALNWLADHLEETEQ